MACLKRVLMVCALLALMPAAVAWVGHAPTDAQRSMATLLPHMPAGVVLRSADVPPEDDADDSVDPAPQDALTTDIKIPCAPRRGAPLPSTTTPSWTTQCPVSAPDLRGPPIFLS